MDSRLTRKPLFSSLKSLPSGWHASLSVSIIFDPFFIKDFLLTTIAVVVVAG